MTTSEPPRPGSGMDLARVALRRAKEDARRGRFSETPTSARRRTKYGRTPPASFADVLLAMFTERGLGHLCHPTSASVITQWDSLAGPIARHVIPVGFDEDTATLTLHCDSTAWLTQMRLLADALLKRLNDELGLGKVQAFHLVKGAVVPNVPRHVETSDVAHAVVHKPRPPLPDPDIEAARRRQAQCMPREPARRSSAF
ncbi:DciA family protein [Streptomyces chartreusis]|uniref:DciA family protein n=1 Tax=Streptomyces chartreusis TaxID=1969 RepID=UPI003640BDDB